MVYIFLSQLIFIIFIGGSIVILSWLFPVNHKSQKKNKVKKA